MSIGKRVSFQKTCRVVLVGDAFLLGDQRLGKKDNTWLLGDQIFFVN